MKAAANIHHLIYRGLVLPKLEAIAEPWAVRHIRPTVEGDPEAALSLAGALGNARRGAFAVALWRMHIPHSAFRPFLASVWDHDHRVLIAAAATRRRLRAMFRYAAFELPDTLPERVTVWRGTSALPYSRAARGLSWTTDRDCACWFAMRFAKRNGRPLVLRAEVPREAIALYHDERSEAEAVIFDVGGPPEISGGTEDWVRGHDRRATECYAERAALFAAYAEG